jgi:hypothetical protein
MSNQSNPTIIADDDPTDEQLELAFRRAEREFGDCVADYESEEFTTEFGDQLNRILTGVAIDGLIEKGLLETNVREDGELGYTHTPKGLAVREYIESQR